MSSLYTLYQVIRLVYQNHYCYFDRCTFQIQNDVQNDEQKIHNDCARMVICMTCNRKACERWTDALPHECVWVFSLIVSACPLQVIALDEYEYVFSMNSQQPFGVVQIQKALSSTFDHKSFRN